MNCGKGNINETFAFKVGVEITSALQSLHSIGFAHSDLKLENICVEGDYKDIQNLKVTLIDYGMANNFRESNSPSKYQFQGNILFASGA